LSAPLPSFDFLPVRCRIPAAPIVVVGNGDIIKQKGELHEHASRRQGSRILLSSIEKKYGQPVAHWFGLLGTQSGKKHMELVAWLKAEHGLGHGHANALVAHHLASRAS
jgi:hypothetical protein